MEEKKELMQEVESVVSRLNRLFYITSVFFPIFGIIVGFVLQTRGFKDEVRTIGRTCFWISVVVIIVMGIMAVVLFARIIK